MIPREIYTLGAVGLDTRQLANLEGQLLAKREAKQKAEEDAINKYITDLGSKITPAGVRTNDLAEFENKRRKWQAYAIQNKGKISKDPLVRMESDALYNDVLAFAQQSKKAEEDKKPALDLYRNPNTRGKMNGERVIQAIALHDLPLTDPRRKEIDYNASWYRDPVYDFIKDFESASKGQQKAFLKRIPNSFDPVSGNWKTEEGYLPRSIKQIADNFATIVAADPEKMDYWERQANKNMPAGEVVRLNKLLNNYFPNIQVEADNPLALAMAKAIEQAESIKDQGQQKDVQYQQQLAERTARAGKSTEGPYYDYWAEVINKPILDIGFKGTVTGVLGTYKNPRITGRAINSLTPTAQERIINIANSITGGKFKQDDLILTEDKNGKIHIASVIYDDELKNGQPTGKKIPIRTQEITPISSIDLNLKPQINVASKTEAIQQAKSEQGKTYNVGGKSFSKAQLEAAAKKYKMTFSQYLQSLGINE